MLTFASNEINLPTPCYYCRRCDSFIGTEECPFCSCQAAPIDPEKAAQLLAETTMARAREWMKRGRIIPEVE